MDITVIFFDIPHSHDGYRFVYPLYTYIVYAFLQRPKKENITIYVYTYAGEENRKEEKMTVGGEEKIRYKEKKAEPSARKGVFEENREKEWWGSLGQRNWKKWMEYEEGE